MAKCNNRRGCTHHKRTCGDILVFHENVECKFLQSVQSEVTKSCTEEACKPSEWLQSKQLAMQEGHGKTQTDGGQTEAERRHD